MAKDPGLGMVFTYNEMRRDTAVLAAVEDALLSEQGRICAYTGRLLVRGNFHVEHLLPQHPPPGTEFYRGHDTHYDNLVACWPEPNHVPRPEYGAVYKENWPSPDEVGDFLSPLHPRCGAAYTFGRLGEISLVNPADDAAGKTRDKLNLNHAELCALRRSTILGALEPNGKRLTLSQVEKVLRELEKDEARLDAGDNDVQLRRFCFAIRPLAARLASKLASIAASKRTK
jgi:uncharacterized protein (TIGR02646 family)